MSALKGDFTPWQTRIMREFAAGWETKTIARRVCRSPSTVYTTLMRIGVKLGVTRLEDLRVLLIAQALPGELEVRSWGENEER